ncbi:fatty acid desaturase-domain-containing protein [Phyllosticta capitalensis]|uniref:fatty acid desaturase-domain-containing protein n=1 Tax=Phyllosticta capitalensis TaxID=121624 RepID=UPI003130AE43
MATQTVTLTSTKEVQPVKADKSTRDVSKCPTLGDIKKAIPPHCFEPSVAISMSYMVRDIILVAILGWAGLQIPRIETFWIRAAAWILYGFTQGLIFTGIWILSHECGHGAFSKHRVLNDTVGWFGHSFLLVPYFSWKFSHARHHRFTGHIEKDLVFVPKTQEDMASKLKITVNALNELAEDTPIVNAAKLLFHQLFGWQTYLLFNVSAGKQSRVRDNNKTSWFNQRGSHFDPWSVLFIPRQAIFIILSDLGLAIMGYILYLAAQKVGWQMVGLLYGQSYFWVHHWLVAITYLHHTHPDVPHYAEGTWNFTLGNLCTIDRDFGWIDQHLFHGIIGTHSVHHLFPRIPFYYADEATEAIRPLLGEFYNQDKTNFLVSLWHTFKTCRWVKQVEEGATRGVYVWAGKTMEK